MKKTEIAPFSPEQQSAVAQLWTMIFVEMGWPTNSIDSIENVLELFHPPEGFLLTVENDGLVVGCGGIKAIDATTGEIKRFYLESSQRGSGMAKELLAALIAESKARGFKWLILEVHFQNERAITFYEKHGFRLDTSQSENGELSSQSGNTFYSYKLELL